MSFDPNNEAEYCSICKGRPEWEEVWENGWQCLNCGSITNDKGIVEEERRWHEEGDGEE